MSPILSLSCFVIQSHGCSTVRKLPKPLTLSRDAPHARSLYSVLKDWFEDTKSRSLPSCDVYRPTSNIKIHFSLLQAHREVTFLGSIAVVMCISYWPSPQKTSLTCSFMLMRFMKLRATLKSTCSKWHPTVSLGCRWPWGGGLHPRTGVSTLDSSVNKN